MVAVVVGISKEERQVCGSVVRISSDRFRKEISQRLIGGPTGSLRLADGNS